MYIQKVEGQKDSMNLLWKYRQGKIRGAKGLVIRGANVLSHFRKIGTNVLRPYDHVHDGMAYKYQKSLRGRNFIERVRKVEISMLVEVCDTVLNWPNAKLKIGDIVLTTTWTFCIVMSTFLNDDILLPRFWTFCWHIITTVLNILLTFPVHTLEWIFFFLSKTCVCLATSNLFFVFYILYWQLL